MFERQVFVELDHKPLEVIFKKWLHQAPKRCTPLMYSISIGYRKRSTMHLADILSWAYLPYDGSQEVASEVESINMMQHIFFKPSALQEIKDVPLYIPEG